MPHPLETLIFRICTRDYGSAFYSFISMLLKFDFSGTNFLIVELSLNLAFSLSIQPCLG